MKKWLIGISSLIVIVIAAIYIFIPSKLVVSKVSKVKCSVNGASRFLIDESRWPGWWPVKNGNKSPDPKEKIGIAVFDYNGFYYHLSQKFYNSAEITISNEQFKGISRVNLIKASSDSVFLEWTCQVPSSLNPVKRWIAYRKAVNISKNMIDILGSLTSFLEKNENVYGVNIHQIYSKDSTLITTRKITNTYPSTEEIYEMINQLKKHIAEEGASMNNVPMLNVRFRPGPLFETMVAIPVNRVLKETPNILNKRFVPWKTLVGDVKGGVSTIQRAQREMQIYIDDHQRNAMGIPFESLITDRSKEPDTLKWITRICQAVS